MSLENVSIVPLKDVVKRVKVGFVGSCNNDYCSSDEGVPMIRTTNLTTEGIKLENLKYINNTFHIAHKKSQLHFGDILIARHGHNGLASLWEYKFDAQCLNVVVVEPDESLANRYYLTYLINSPLIQKQIKSLTGGSVQSVVNTKDIADLLIPIPSLDKQKGIADFISLFNKKISVCKSINKNLEHLLYNIFYYWFISFEKFNDVDFIETEIGKIPKGWEVGILKDILTLTKNTINPRKTNGLPYLPIDIIPMNSLGILELKSDEEANSSLITFDKNDILIGAMRVYFHRVVVSPCSGVTRSTCFVLKPKKETYLSYSLLLCNLNQTIHYAQNTSKGTTMPYAVWNNGLGDMEILIPPENILNEFHMIVFPIIKKIRDSYNEINKLTKLRDTLLPKLMSGEIDVSKINCDLELKYNYMKYLFNQIHKQLSKSVV